MGPVDRLERSLRRAVGKTRIGQNLAGPADTIKNKSALKSVCGLIVELGSSD